MSAQPSPRNFIELFWWSSKDLDSERFYDAMDIVPHDMYNFKKKCNDIIVKNHKNEMIPICIKYQRFLDKCLLWSGLNNKYNVPLLLSYWLYEKLISIYGDTNEDEIGIGFGALQGIWDTFTYKPIYGTDYKNCKPELNIVHHKDWKNRKQLHDYYVDYHSLFETARTHDTFCKQYYTKIKEFSSLYEYFRGQCSTDGDECPELFHKFKNENREYNLEILPCHAEMEQQLDAAAKAKARLPDHHPGSEPGPEAPLEGSESRGSEIDTPHRETTTETSGIGKKVSHTVLGVAPVLLTATMLYRYTPVGPWIRRFGGGRTNNMNPMDTFSPYAQETGDKFSENTENYISYQPI